jgi:hypothetical protein
MSRNNINDIPGAAASDLSDKCSGLLTTGAAQRGIGGMVYCLNGHQMICEHAVHFGDTHYCLHPHNPELTGRHKIYGEEHLPGKK